MALTRARRPRAGTAGRTFPLGVGESRRARTVMLGNGRSIPPQSSIITSDAYTGGNVADIAGRNSDATLGGVAKTWAVSAGTEIGIVSGDFIRTSGSTTRRCGFDLSSGNVWVTVVARDTAGVFAGSFFQIRRSDVTTASTDHYRITIGSTGTVILSKVVGGVTTNLSPTLGPVAAGTKVGVYASGSRIGMTIGNVSVWEVDDTDVAASRTFFAVQLQGANSGQHDNLIISQL